MTPEQRLMKNILESAEAADMAPVTSEMLKAGRTYLEQVDEAISIDSVEDLEDDVLRCLYMIMSAAGRPPGKVKMGGKTIGEVVDIRVGQEKPEAKPPQTAEWLVALEKKVAGVDYRLVAEMVREKVSDLNVAFELLWSLGVDIQLFDEPQSESGRHAGPFGVTIHELMFGSVGRRAAPSRKYPKLKVTLTKKEKL